MNQVTMELDRYEALLEENIRLKLQIEEAKKTTTIDDNTVYNEPLVEWKLIPFYSVTVLSAWNYSKMMDHNKITVEDLKKALEEPEAFEAMLNLRAPSQYGSGDPLLQVNTQHATTTIKFGIDTFYIALDRSYPEITSIKKFEEQSRFMNYDDALEFGRNQVKTEMKRAIADIEKKAEEAK